MFQYELFDGKKANVTFLNAFLGEPTRKDASMARLSFDNGAEMVVATTFLKKIARQA